MTHKNSLNHRLLVVDDDEQVCDLLGRLLEREGHRCTAAANAEQARGYLARGSYDLLVANVRLPDGSGLDLIAEGLAEHPRMGALVVSGIDDLSLAEGCLEVGAYGYVVKPFTANEVLIGVLGALRSRHKAVDARGELRASQEAIRRLAIAVEAHDPGVAPHIHQMSDYCGRLARELDLPPKAANRIRAASQLHDIGNAAVPDRVLLKPGPLTPEERNQMERHAELGYRALAGSPAELLQTAASIAWTHHERFDGSGYPRGLSGEDIPLEGRIAAVADVFDSLMRDRLYRPRFTRAKAIEIMEERRAQFDPAVLGALRRILERRDVQATYQRDEPAVGGLTPRELEVLQLAADGNSAGDIADKLELSRGTVKTHFQHIYEKLEARGRAGAVAVGLRAGLIH